ncbi:iron(III) transport system substrate-binding protein [Agrobacterium vitis]|nr:iron(III) transport system substrate-binding protein [Agrobacterium vitis]MBE1438762.1 iron(III) transport system substrate-binding protein [Agrobacterium vitis]
MKRLFSLLWPCLWLCAANSFAAEGERVVFVAPQPEQARLVIHAATDLDAMRPLVLDFQQIEPNTTIEITDYVTNDLFRDSALACANGSRMADIVLSSSVDQLVKLANDGCAQPHQSIETASVADWANWRNEVFGFTFEPAVFVYDASRVPAEDVPKSHEGLADLLRRKPTEYQGRIGTYDINASGVGYLLAFNDARIAPTVYGRLLESLSRTKAIIRCCNNEVLGEIANGNIRIAYNVLGSYAYAASLKNPDLKIVIPRDYALILSRGAMIPVRAAHPELGTRFLNYLLSVRGRKTARDKSFFFAKGFDLPPGVDGPVSLIESGIGRPIRIGPALLAAQDEAQRKRFIQDWQKLILQR